MRAVALAGLSASVFLAGCGAQLGGGGANSCGPSYVVHAGKTITNTCAGVIPPRPMRFSVTVGQRFAIEIGHEESGALDFPIPAPDGPEVQTVGRDGASVTYVARSSGMTRLVAHHTRYCVASSGRIASCVVAAVRVGG